MEIQQEPILQIGYFITLDFSCCNVQPYDARHFFFNYINGTKRCFRTYNQFVHGEGSSVQRNMIGESSIHGWVL